MSDPLNPFNLKIRELLSELERTRNRSILIERSIGARQAYLQEHIKGIKLLTEGKAEPRQLIEQARNVLSRVELFLSRSQEDPEDLLGYLDDPEGLSRPQGNPEGRP